MLGMLRTLALTTALGWAASQPSAAGEIQAAKTDGDGWFETCSFFGMWCAIHATTVPELVKQGQVIELVSQGKNYGEFYIDRITQESSGNCFLHKSPYRDIEGVVRLGKCEPIAASVVPPTKLEMKKLREAIHDLGSMEGIVVLCAQSPKIDIDTALRWYMMATELEELSAKYAEHIMPNDAVSQGAVMIAFVSASQGQQESPERVWDDPSACGDDMESEISRFIRGWSSHINTLG